MRIGDYYFSLEFSQGDCVLDPEEPEDYLYSVSGKIIAYDHDQKTSEAGRFHVYYLDICAALNANISSFDVFDSDSSTIDYYNAIFDGRRSTVSNKLRSLFDDEIGWGNVLILNRLELLPEYRHRNLGLVVMRRLIERFGAGAFVVAIKPFPLQFEFESAEEAGWRSRLQLGDLSEKPRAATKKLCAYYARLGFKALKGTPFMFRAADEPLPKLDHE